MATTDHLFFDLQFSKDNFDGPIMQLQKNEKIISILLLFLLQVSIQERCLKIDERYID